MPDYKAPLDDIRFALTRVAGLSEIQALPRFADATDDVVDAILEEAARFAEQVLGPTNQVGDAVGTKVVDRAVVLPDEFREAYAAFVDAGWQSLPFPEEIGGQGMPELIGVVAAEMWQSANMAFALCPMLTESAVIAMHAHAPAELNAVYLEKLVTGRWTGTMNLTEPQAGTDLAAVKCRAEPDGDAYRIYGQKIYITWGDHDAAENTLHLVLARLPDAPPGIKGISLFAVPKYLPNQDGTPGARNDVYPVSVEHKLGIHGSPTCVMSYGDVDGALGWLVGEPNNGVACMFTMMNHARLAVGVQGLAISVRAYHKALEYARERVQGRAPDGTPGATIIHHPDVRRMLMTMKSGVEAMRYLAYYAAARGDFASHAETESERGASRQLFELLTPVVKGWCTEFAQELTSLGVQVHGGMGYVEETGAAQFLRDARITTIYEGTTAIQANDLVGRKFIRDGGEAMAVLRGLMSETVSALAGAGDLRLTITGRALERGVADLERAGERLLADGASDVCAPGSAAVNFLMLTGTVAGGWLLARAAIAALETGDPAAEGRVATARFYAEHLLPRAAAHADAVIAGSDAVMALDEAAF